MQLGRPARYGGPALGGVLALGLLVAALAAKSSPSHPFSARSHAPHTVAPRSVSPRAGLTRGATAHAPSTVTNTSIWAVIVVAVAVVAVVVFVLRRWRPHWQRPALRRAGPSGVAGMAPPGPDDVAAALERGLDPLTAAGSVSEAVIACWVAVGESLRARGFEARPAETSTEQVGRVLREYAVDPDALDTLSGLYREARFSAHRLSEDDRATATLALERIRGDLRGARHG